MRIIEHPIITFRRGRKVEFEFDGQRLFGFEGESIAAALHASGVRVLRRSIRKGRPRGFFCAIGRCSSCLMTVDGVPNVMTCVTPLRDGMKISTQTGKGAPPPDAGQDGDGGAEARERDEGSRGPGGPVGLSDMGRVPLAVVGAGPAGLSAAIAAGKLGVRTLVFDENEVAGGQLIKQTHMFFGSREHYARVRGIDIGRKLLDEAAGLPVEIMTGVTVLGLYEGKTLSLLGGGRHSRITADAVVVATGASENALLFENCDLPGVYGAGAVQTLMNVHGVVPAKSVLMVGAGNIGLIVSYQLLQAGVEVAGVIEAAPEVGGYHVHAAKIRRAGVPILTSHTILRALGGERVEAAEICRVDEDWQPVPGTERTLDVDAVCLAVGLTPNCELALQTGCAQANVPELGGWVALHDDDLMTAVPGVFIAGDASGIEEASTAMLEGRLAGIAAAERIAPGLDREKVRKLKEEAREGLRELRAGPFGERPRLGKRRMLEAWKREGQDR